MKDLIRVSIRQKAVYVPEKEFSCDPVALTGGAALFSANLAKLGFGLSEQLLGALNKTSAGFLEDLLTVFRSVMQVDRNWTPLVKGWDVPTGESITDHIVTFFANVFQADGEILACGHIIPPNTFPLERYNGCPFCGTPFRFGELTLKARGSGLKVLELWGESELMGYFEDLLTSKTALDTTQMDSLRILLSAFPLPGVTIAMKETMMAVIDILLKVNHWHDAGQMFKTPTDILRYLWYKHTGFLQIFKPKTIIQRKVKNSRAVYFPVNKEEIEKTMRQAEVDTKKELKLKFRRKHCRWAASWLNTMDMDPGKMCETMHPHRGMWVRFIRALRLPEYARKKDFGRLKELLDLFYNKKYEVWQGRLNDYILHSDVENAMRMLKERPGIFARSLFACMLRFGQHPVTKAFMEISDNVPARLLFTLHMYADYYFNPGGTRTVKPLGGQNKVIPNNKLLANYTSSRIDEIKNSVADICLSSMKKRYARIKTTNTTLFIDPVLFHIPVAIGDRSESVQDLPVTLMGTRFKSPGTRIRLFMQWGSGLPAQHLDMDLSCFIAFKTHSESCSYRQLTATGCKHSGDIRSIPDRVGTAEYIELDLEALRKAKALYVTFTCNAYSSGELSPNLVVGWMTSEYPMDISEETGVAYDPSCVQHQVRITRQLTKGLVFGVLDVVTGEIIWLEMPFGGQVVQNLDFNAVKGMLKKLESKLSIGNLLLVKAEAQNLEIMETPGADEVYDLKWAANAAAVTQLLID